MTFLEEKVIFSSNFASLFSVMRHNSSNSSSKTLYGLDKMSTSKAKFQISTAYMKIKPIPYVIFRATSQFSFKFCIIL